MAIDIPAPFDILNTKDYENSVIGATSSGLKDNGGIQLDEQGVDWHANDTAADEGLRYNFNSTGAAVDMTDEIFIIS